MVDHSSMKLGRGFPRRDRRTLKLAGYLSPGLPPPPVELDWTGGLADWGAMLNDKLSCCTIAGLGHAIQTWSRNAGQEVTISDLDVLTAYEQWDGYSPADPSTDQGGIEIDVLNRWRNSALGGHKLFAFAAAASNKMAELRRAIALFGGVYIGLDLAIAQQTQDVWDVDKTVNGDAGSWGGHAVWVPAYTEGTFKCITWGIVKEMTDAFLISQCSEAWALFGADWINTGGKAPSGFDAAQLTADLQAIH